MEALQDNSLSLLVVMPHPASLLCHASYLRWYQHLQMQQGWTCVLCQDAGQAERMAVEMHAAVIFQAMHMEGAHGLDMLRSYRRHPKLKDCPVIMMDERQQGLLRRYAFVRGANDVMHAAWDRVETRQKIHAIVQARRMQQAYMDLQCEHRVQERQLQQCQQQLKRASSLDALTRLPNRQHFAALYEREWQRALRETEALSLILVDVDHFKAYNDTYGYKQGDACLQQIAAHIPPLLQRPTDVCGRYSGAALMVLLPMTPAKGAIQVAERIRQAVEGLDIPHAQSETHAVVTVSVGLVTTCPMMKHQARDMIRMVERARFEAKQQGRNCLVCKSL